MTVNELVKILDLSSGSPTAWKNGTIPRTATLARIAEYFGVTTDYLLGKESGADSTEAKQPDILDEVDVAFYGDYKELSEDDKETLRAMARVMKERQAKRNQEKK